MIGPIAGTLGVMGFGYQLFKMISTGQTRAMLFPLSLFAGISIGMWAAYGIEKNDPVIFVPNGILVIILPGMALFKWKSERLVWLEDLRE